MSGEDWAAPLQSVRLDGGEGRDSWRAAASEEEEEEGEGAPGEELSSEELEAVARLSRG
jgi:hypothetical protein